MKAIVLLGILLPAFSFAQEVPEETPFRFEFDDDRYIDPEKKWYFEAKPGYYYFSDRAMRHFFDDGGFAFRGEVGCKFWDPIIVWADIGYFQKEGKALGGTEKIDFKLATITLGLKTIYYFCDYIAMYAGVGPRLFMMLMDNHSPFVRSEDNEIGVGGGFDAGLWVFPIPCYPNIFFDVFADYSWKEMQVQPDEISSFDYDVDVSGLTAGVGLGVRF